MYPAMKSRRLNVSEDSLTISRRNTTSKNDGERSDPIHIDVIMMILSRLPAKSMARFRSVSKLWASMLVLPYFTELFITQSLARPRLLFACIKGGKMFLFSSPQPRKVPDENSLALKAISHMSFPFSLCYDIISPVNGLLCLRAGRVLEGRKNPVLESVICNPSTGKSLTLPKMNTRRKIGVRSYLGYDPLEKLFKVLSVTWLTNRSNVSFEEFQVLTLGTQEPSWRMIECSVPHFSRHNKGMCINGVLYYKAAVNIYLPDSMIVCFDIRSEKFRFINIEANVRHGTLINYHGKLGSLASEGSSLVSDASRSITMCVLEDAEKEEWLEYTYVLPASWLHIVGMYDFSFVGVTRTNEIVLSPSSVYGPVYVVYYDIKTRTATKLLIQGVKRCHELHTFLDHVEDVKPMQMF